MAVINGLLHQDLEFISSKKYRNGHLWFVRKKRSEQACRRCGLFSKRRAGRVSVTVRERSPEDSPLWLRVEKHRYYCTFCRKPFTEETPGVYFKQRTTRRFQKWIKQCCVNFVNLKKVSYKNYCSAGFVYKVYYEQLEIKTRELKQRTWPSVLGIDEHFFTRRRGFPEYVTVFTDLSKRKLFDVAETKRKKTLLEQYQKSPGRLDVKIVCMDLSSVYRSLVKELFPNARIVADKFHVMKLLMPSIMKERQSVEGHHKKTLGRKRLLCHRGRLDYSIRSEMDVALKNYSGLNELYRAKESLARLYRCSGFKRAFLSYRKLVAQLEKANHPRLKTLLKTLIKWRDEILSYFQIKVTNGVTEAINGNAKALQRRARGYKQFKNYRLALLNACSF